MTWLLLSTAGGQFSSQTENKIEEEEGQGDEEDRVGPVLLDHHGLRQRQVQLLPRQLPPVRGVRIKIHDLSLRAFVIRNFLSESGFDVEVTDQEPGQQAAFHVQALRQREDVRVPGLGPQKSPAVVDGIESTFLSSNWRVLTVERL